MSMFYKPALSIHHLHRKDARSQFIRLLSTVENQLPKIITFSLKALVNVSLTIIHFVCKEINAVPLMAGLL